MRLEVGRCDPDAVAALLHGLPDWFGIEEATSGSIEAARTMPTVLCLEARVIVGALLWTKRFPAAAEVYLMAVDAARHRGGIGTALLECAEQELRADGVEFLQVKTLGPSYPHEEYERTRLFYEAPGSSRWKTPSGSGPRTTPC
jgi:GNAT superfamily N-acetyltransferase